MESCLGRRVFRVGGEVSQKILCNLLVASLLIDMIKVNSIVPLSCKDHSNPRGFVLPLSVDILTLLEGFVMCFICDITILSCFWRDWLLLNPPVLSFFCSPQDEGQVFKLWRQVLCVYFHFPLPCLNP